jgi:hypothetical protein
LKGSLPGNLSFAQFNCEQIEKAREANLEAWRLNSKNKLLCGAGLALLLCMMSPARVVKGDQWNKETTLTVEETIQIPGATLTPGKYVFKLMDSSADRHIVQVYNEDQDHLLATIMAIPNCRLRPSGKSEFSFWETPSDTPPALRSWFYPGDNFGQEFAYPESEHVH